MYILTTLLLIISGISLSMNDDTKKLLDVVPILYTHLYTHNSPTDISFTHDGTQLAYIFDKYRSIILHSTINTEKAHSIECPTKPLTICCGPYTGCVATGDEKGDVYLWTNIESKHHYTLKGHTGKINKICFSNDGNFLVSASDDKTGRIWDLKTNKLIKTFKHPGPVKAVCFNFNSKTILSAGYGDAHGNGYHHTICGGNCAKIRCFKKLIDTFPCDHEYKETSNVNDIQFNPDGTFFAATCDHSLFVVGQQEHGYKSHIVKGHSDTITSISFNPNNTLLASAALDNTIRLWDSSSPSLLSCIKTLKTQKPIKIQFNPQNPNMFAKVSSNGIDLVDLTLFNAVRSNKLSKETAYAVQALIKEKDEQERQYTEKFNTLLNEFAVQKS